tara:strand:+ start:2083 stop:2268 length:186 start_codon:yes stop_codon:yes gene_type:complete
MNTSANAVGESWLDEAVPENVLKLLSLLSVKRFSRILFDPPVFVIVIPDENWPRTLFSLYL